MWQQFICASLRAIGWAHVQLAPPGTIIMLHTGHINGYDQADVQFQSNMPVALASDLLSETADRMKSRAIYEQTWGARP